MGWLHYIAGADEAAQAGPRSTSRNMNMDMKDDNYERRYVG